MNPVTILPVEGMPEVAPGDDLGLLVAGCIALADGDIVVVAQKVVSKSEGRIVDLGDVTASPEAVRLAAGLDQAPDPRVVQVILDESVRLVRSERVLISETRHGFVCANAGVDHSNVVGEDMVTVLPVDPDLSARRLRERLAELTGKQVGVIVSDTFGRPWRLGIVNVALGVAGLPALVDMRGQLDATNKRLTATMVATGDELAAAAGLLMAKAARIPVVVLRGAQLAGADGTGRDLVRPAGDDLFR